MSLLKVKMQNIKLENFLSVKIENYHNFYKRKLDLA